MRTIILRKLLIRSLLKLFSSFIPHIVQVPLMPFFSSTILYIPLCISTYPNQMLHAFPTFAFLFSSSLYSPFCQRDDNPNVNLLTPTSRKHLAETETRIYIVMIKIINGCYQPIISPTDTTLDINSSARQMKKDIFFFIIFLIAAVRWLLPNNTIMFDFVF